MKIVKLEYVDRCPSCNYHFLDKDAIDYKIGENSWGTLIQCPNCGHVTRIDEEDGREIILEEGKHG